MTQMTEEEAKTKWCPFARVVLPNHGLAAPVNRVSDGKGNEALSMCIASACMAWRVPVHASDCATHNMPAIPAGPCDCNPRGYCGLAGKE